MINVPNKIGFHTGPGGNPTGIGDWMRALDKAGIPFCLKSVDHYGPIFEAQELMKQSNVPHVLIYRMSTRGQNDGYDYDVPPYKDPKFVNDPEGGAEHHWKMTLAKLPPEFDRQRVWLEPINEVDKDLCDWLGRFAVRTADLAQEEGMKVTLFAWSSGEPEPTGWEEPGMLAYLRLCGERPQQAAVALHEYSYVEADIFDKFPFKIGRFQYLFATCDKHNIPRPRVHITEWGWTLNSVPVPEKAIPDIRKVGQVYAPFPEIEGAAIWYLGPGFDGIADKAQRLIKPVTDFTLAERFEVEALSPPIEPLPAIGDWQQYPPDNGDDDMTTQVKTAVFGSAAGLSDKTPTGLELQYSYQEDEVLKWVNLGALSMDGIDLTKDIREIRIRVFVNVPRDEPENPNPPADPPGSIEIADIVDDLPQHATLTYSTRPLSGITTLTIHHTVSPPDRSIESIAAYHVDSNGWPGIGYHYVIKDDGRIFQTNYLETKSYHAGSAAAPGDENAISVGISLQGDFTNAPPPTAQQDAARALVGYLSGLLPSVTAVLGHRQMPGAQTQCPGNTFQSWLPYVSSGLGEAVLKFQPGDRVEVHTEELNVRNAPYGTLLGSQQPGAKGTVIEGGVANGGFVWWNVNFDIGIDGWCAENWLQKTTATQPPAEKLDMLQFLRGDGRIFEMQHAGGGQERNQVQPHPTDPNAWYVCKGENEGHWELWRLVTMVVDGEIEEVFCLDTDTSAANASDGTARYYKIRKNDGLAPKYRRFMAVGESFGDSGHVVQFYRKDNCQPHPENSGPAANVTLIVALHEEMEFANGIVLQNVLEVQENSETQFWCAGYGRVKWVSPWGSSQISEEHAPGQRPDIKREVIGCLG